MSYTTKNQIRKGLPQVGVKPYRQIHAHSTGNRKSTAQNEADYMNRKNINEGFFTHVVGNGTVIQTAPLNQGAWDVGGGWNSETYAAIELIESHKTKEEFLRDYTIYIELIRDLAKKGNIKLALDTSGTEGVKTHDYCTHNQPYNKSDHVDPYPYLKKWGITKEQFKKDVENGLAKKVWPKVTQGVSKCPSKGLAYRGHIQSQGWLGYLTKGAAGTTGQGRRLEAVEVRVDGSKANVELAGHIEQTGWQPYEKGICGTTGVGKRLEAVKIRLTGSLADKYDIEYRVHQQTYGWSKWAKNGVEAGVTGEGLRIEAVEIRLVKPKEVPSNYFICYNNK